MHDTDKTIRNHDLHSMRVAQNQAQPGTELYEIVPDGELFAITVRGEIQVHDLDPGDLPKARSIVDALNRFIKDERVS